MKHGVRLHIYNLHSADAGELEVSSELEAPSRKPLSARRRLVGATIVLIVGVVVALIFAWMYHASTAHFLTSDDTVLLADVVNGTGDTVFDDTIRAALRLQLKQSAFLNLVSGDRIQAGLRLLGRPENTPLSPSFAGELCRAVGSKAYLIGSLDGSKGSLVLNLRAVNCRARRYAV